MASELYMRLLKLYKSVGERENKQGLVKMADEMIKKEIAPQLSEEYTNNLEDDSEDLGN